MEPSRHRLAFEELPEEVRHRLETALGSRVVTATTRPGGYSPSLAARLDLADRRTVFAKAASPAQNPDAPDFLRREAAVSAALPDSAPAPRLLHLLDDGGWVVMVYEHVDGSLPHIPWDPDELAQVLDATWRLAEVAAPPSLPTALERYRSLLDGWRNLARDPPPAGLLDEWCLRHLDRLAGAEPAWEEALSGRELVHGDVRSDNVIIGPRGVTFVDWPAACTGRNLFDVVSMLPSVALEGGGEPDDVLGANGGQGVERDAVTAVVLADTGYFLDRARQPDPPGLPTVRAFQLAQGRVCLAWLRQRLGWR